MSTIMRTSDHSMQINNGPGRSTLNLISSGVGKHRNISVNISGPRGGSQQALIVSADDILEALVELDAISEVTTWNYVEIVTDGRCICGVEIPEGDIVCEECFEKARARR